MKIFQHTPTLLPYDAVSDNVIHINDLLNQNGYHSEIIVDVRSRESNYSANLIDETKINKDDILILHFSIGSDTYNKIDNIKCKKILIYHNITPFKYFLEYSKGLYDRSLLGYQQIRSIRPYISHAFADSTFNAKELIKFGYTDPVVLPLYYNIDKRTKKAKQKTYKKQKEIVILFVGRIAPNKCQIDLIKAFYFYQKYFQTNSRLKLIGGHTGMEKYLFEMNSLITKLQLNAKVDIPGKVSDKELGDYYNCSDLFFSMSEHEGFCAPIIESMIVGLPIFAYYYSGAIPETAGSGAVFFTKKNYFEVSSVMNEIITNTELRQTLKRNQQIELKRFEPKNIEDKILYHINNITKKHENKP